MRPVFVSFIVLLWAGFVMLTRWTEHPVPVGAPTPPPSGPEWINLLDAAHAGGWKNITDDKNIFEVRDGVLHIFGSTLYPLRYVGYTSEPFSNFDLHVEFKLVHAANSGVFLRVLEGDPVKRGFEVQVLDDFGQPPNKNGSGAIYDVVSPMFNMARPAGEWNSYDIRVANAVVTVTMNGWKIIEANFDQMTSPIGKFTIPYASLPFDGIIALQDHGGEVWYRNVYVRPHTMTPSIH
ncbi:MAG: DUF1080 domain-containing protein [Candidatus Hydrogenedentes bacterium]|nr:DUF1080 domain-containing protein [Candidatus Hydrogenedentota bacterium]